MQSSCLFSDADVAAVLAKLRSQSSPTSFPIPNAYPNGAFKTCLKCAERWDANFAINTDSPSYRRALRSYSPGTLVGYARGYAVSSKSHVTGTQQFSPWVQPRSDEMAGAVWTRMEHPADMPMWKVILERSRPVTEEALDRLCEAICVPDGDKVVVDLDLPMFVLGAPFGGTRRQFFEVMTVMVRDSGPFCVSSPTLCQPEFELDKETWYLTSATSLLGAGRRPNCVAVPDVCGTCGMCHVEVRALECIKAGSRLVVDQVLRRPCDHDDDAVVMDIRHPEVVRLMKGSARQRAHLDRQRELKDMDRALGIVDKGINDKGDAVPATQRAAKKNKKKKAKARVRAELLVEHAEAAVAEAEVHVAAQAPRAVMCVEKEEVCCLCDEEEEEVQEPDTCSVCMERRKSHVLVPCGHFLFCEDCLRGCTICPLCRADVMQVVRVYQ